MKRVTIGLMAVVAAMTVAERGKLAADGTCNLVPSRFPLGL